MQHRRITVESYAARIDRALRHLAEHLDEDLPLERLAAIACFSPCHFHRIWRGMVGETVAETTRRLRLQRAATELIRDSRPIVRIARDAGYAGPSPFVRAFRSAFGLPPAAYRAARGLSGPRFGPNRNEEKDPMHDIVIERRDPIRLAVLRHVGDYHAIGTVFDRLEVWARARGIARPDARYIGIYHDDPTAVPQDKLRSDAGISLPDGAEPDGEVALAEIPAGRSAVLRFRGPYAELDGAYRFLFGTWLPQSGEEPADLPCFEEYLNDPHTLPPTEWLTAIHLPLAPRPGAS